jgi:subtilisin family serine protease
MSKLRLLFLCLAAGLLAAMLHAAPPQPVADELLVKMRGRVADADQDALAGKIGGHCLRRFSRVGWQHVKLPPGMTAEEASRKFRGMAEVASVEPNYLVHTDAVPNDAAWSRQWSMPKIGAPGAWNTVTGSNTVVVGVLDTGVNYLHDDLRANLWTNPGEVPGNRIDDDRDGYIDDVYGVNTISRSGDPMDTQGHGTHVAGIIGAVGNNGMGVAGVSWNVKILAMKFIGSDNTGSTADAIAAYDYAMMLKSRGVNIRVMNNSWSGTNYSQALSDAITAAGNIGILSVAAAGNGNASHIGQNIDVYPEYPAAYAVPAMLAVTAADMYDNAPIFANYGTRVGLAAPGYDIYSTYAGGNNAYALESGTSMATPHVAGAAALLWSLNSTFSVATVKSLILNNVDKLSQWTGRVASGGRLNVARAVASAAGSPILTPDPPPVTPTPPPATTRLTGVGLTIAPMSPQRVNTDITLSAQSNTTAEYRFVAARFSSWWGVISEELRPYATAATCTWRPTAAGSYQITVYARTPGSTTSYEVKSMVPFTVSN